MRKTEPASLPKVTAVRLRKESRTERRARGPASFRRVTARKPRRNSKSDQGDSSGPTSRETPSRDSTVPPSHASEGKPKRSSSRDRNVQVAACALAACGEVAAEGDAGRHIG